MQDQNPRDPEASPPKPEKLETPAEPFGPVFFGALLKLVGGLAVMGFVGLIIGAIFGNLAVQSTAYMSELGNGLSFMFALVPITVVFWIVARASSDRMLAFYPLMAFVVASVLAGSGLVNFIYGSLPIPLPSATGYPDRTYSIVPVMLAYMAVYAYERPLNQMLRRGQDMQTLRVYRVMLALVVAVSLLALVLGGLAYGAQARSRAAVHLPDTAQVASTTVLDLRKDHLAALDFVRIFYQDATVQDDGTYQVTNALNVKPLDAWWDRDTRTNCGAGTSNPENPSETGQYTYKQTPGGVRYGEVTFQKNTIGPTPQTPFKWHYYCFVVDYQKYTLERSEAHGDQYIQKYPAEMVIDAVAGAPAYLPLCGNRGVYDQEASIPRVDYCTAAEAKKVDAHNRSSGKRNTSYHSDIPSMAAPTPSPTPKTYQEVGRLTVKEWGVSFPLSSEINDAYYVMNGDGQADIGLPAYPGDKCFAGMRKGANGGIVAIGNGVAHMLRIKTAVFATYPGYVKGEWPVVGDYSYALSAAIDLSSCPPLYATKQSLGYSLPDIFDWAQKGIR